MIQSIEVLVLSRTSDHAVGKRSEMGIQFLSIETKTFEGCPFVPSATAGKTFTPLLRLIPPDLGSVCNVPAIIVLIRLQSLCEMARVTSH